MSRLSAFAALACAAVLASPVTPAFAHAVCGSRIFPVTLTLDDPGVSDEATLPQFMYQRSGANGGPGPVHGYSFGFEYDKRVTEDFGVGVNDQWNVNQVDNAKTQTGWSNLVVTAKYQSCITADHEFIVSLGVQREFGGTGTLHIGADSHGATTPTLYFGKGFGDLPVGLLRPLALTGEFSYTVADVKLKQYNVVDPNSGNVSQVTNTGGSNSWNGAFSVQYSVPYLQSQVKDYGLGGFWGNMVPLVEVNWSSRASAPSTQSTAWTIAPGVIYLADWYQIGAELLIPANKAAGTNVGFIVQFHVFLDDVFPNSLGKPLLDF